MLGAAAGTGPHWIARLSTRGGELTVIGKASWLGSSANPAIDSAVWTGKSDWQRLMSRCRETDEYLTSLSLWVPIHGYLHAPPGLAGYGYYEVIEQRMNAGLTQKVAAPDRIYCPCAALCICWWTEEEGRPVTKILRYLPFGPTIEYWRQPRWLPCMIGRAKTGTRPEETPLRTGA